MLTTTTQPTVKTAPFIAAILPTCDLSEVMARVARENPEWSADRLTAAENDYRAFWALCKQSPDRRPSKDVDEVWHAHILYTREYARDTESYFGFFLHHVPDNDPCHPQAADCQGGGDGCTSCGSGCNGGGT